MDETGIADVAALAGSTLSDIAPQVLVVGGAGLGLVGLVTIYGMVARAVRSKGKSVG